MNWIDALALGFNRRIVLQRQAEIAECGLACLAMIASYHGRLLDMNGLRHKFNISAQGMHLGDMQTIASHLGLKMRAIKLELADLGRLKFPAVLHWSHNHFVVLAKVRKRQILIYDPVDGKKWIGLDVAKLHFSGVACEFDPSIEFQKVDARQTIRLRSLLGKIEGLKRNLAHIFFLSVILQVFALGSPLMMQWVVDEVLVSYDKDLLFLVVFAGVTIGISELFTSTVRTWVVTHFSSRLGTAWQQQLMDRLLRLKMPYFEKRHVGDILSRLGSAQEIQKLLTTDLIEAVLDGVTAIFTLALMLTYSLMLSMIALGAVLIFALLRVLRYRPVHQIQESIIISDAELETHSLETLRGMQTVKLFQIEEKRLNEWTRRLVINTNHELEMVKTNMFFNGAERVLSITETALILWMGANFVLTGSFSIGAFLAFLAWKVQFISRMDSLVNRLVQIGFVRLYADRLADLVCSPVEFDKATFTGQPAKDKSGLEVVNLSFRYAENQPFLYERLSFSIAQGEFVAIAGASGCGKTTLLKILLGLLDPEEGKIKWQGAELKHWGAAYRNEMATVMQEDQLFMGSVAENIALFDFQMDMQWVMECAKAACIHDEVIAMTMGYHTLVGNMGGSLSGGQKQRILLARALYRRPRLLVLDEATSHLNNELESEINSNIRKLNITRIAVAHRAHTIEMADRLIKLN